jgi:hypothetical protein
MHGAATSEAQAASEYNKLIRSEEASINSILQPAGFCQTSRYSINPEFQHCVQPLQQNQVSTGPKGEIKSLRIIDTKAANKIERTALKARIVLLADHLAEARLPSLAAD